MIEADLEKMIISRQDARDRFAEIDAEIVRLREAALDILMRVAAAPIIDGKIEPLMTPTEVSDAFLAKLNDAFSLNAVAADAARQVVQYFGMYESLADSDAHRDHFFKQLGVWIENLREALP